MDIKDLVLGPIFLFFIYFFLYSYRKTIKDPVLKKIFIQAATAKIVGAILLGVIYQFYYKGGDTYNYFRCSQLMYEVFLKSPSTALQLFFYNQNDKLSGLAFEYGSRIIFLRDPASFYPVQVSFLIGLFCFNTYVVIAIFFSMFSFAGSIALYKVLANEFPEFKKYAANCVFFIPSVIFWGSGLLKDSLTFGALGFFISGFYNLFIARREPLKSGIILFCALMMLKTIKVYIIMCFIPAGILWFFYHYNYKIKSKATRILLVPLLLSTSIFLGLFVGNKISQDNGRYKLENLTTTAKITNEWLSYLSVREKGSVYKIDVDFSSPLSMLKSAPASINVTFYRPYLWEAKNLVMLLSSLESMFMLFYSLKALFTLGPSLYFSYLRKYPLLFSGLVFSLVFGFAIGISTANFGTLVRYKIPALPFFLISIIIPLQLHKQQNNLNKKRRMASLDSV